VALLNVNDVHLYYERIGSGEPLVLVHGSWVDHSSWDQLIPFLSEDFDIVTYDRRGHSASERLDAQGSTDEDAADLAALIEALDMAPAHIVANSFGSVITLRLAASRPELLARLCLHEPPAIPLLLENPANAELLQGLGTQLPAVVAKIAAGEHEDAARQFVDEIALGPGIWESLPAEQKSMFVRNAPTFLDEASDPNTLAVDLDGVSSFEHPVLLTEGDQSPPFYAKIIDVLVEALPNVDRRRIEGTGHVPQLTHPENYSDIVSSFALVRS
jgi:pimeloyl-ACP methyl ester carboxylesterase